MIISIKKLNMHDIGWKDNYFKSAGVVSMLGHRCVASI